MKIMEKEWRNMEKSKLHPEKYGILVMIIYKKRKRQQNI